MDPQNPRTTDTLRYMEVIRGLTPEQLAHELALVEADFLRAQAAYRAVADRRISLLAEADRRKAEARRTAGA